MSRETTLRKTLIGSFAATVYVLASVGTALAADAVANLRSPSGQDVGQVTLIETPHGTLLHAQLRNLPPGPHAFHVHETGKCIPPFGSAGGHFNPTGSGHGLADDDGAHVGDMPNVHVPASGSLEQEILNTRLQLNNDLFDNDGASIVMHAGADDYETNPAGAAGSRIACGVIRR
mgnify:CR=1 FL=1